MIKKQTPTANEILELIEKDYHTKNMLANEFDCSMDTIKSRLKVLRNDGVAIIHSGNGLKAVTRESLVDNIEDSEVMESLVDWFLGSAKGLTRLMAPVKPCLPTMKRALGMNLSKNERKELARACARTTALIMLIEAEEEMG